MIHGLSYRKGIDLRSEDNKISPELWEALNQLTLKEKDAILMYYFSENDFDMVKTAKRLKITKMALWYRLKLASKKLKKLFPQQIKK